MPARRVVLAEYFTTEDLTLLFIVRADFAQPQVVEIKMPLSEIRRFVAAHFGATEGGSKVRELDLDEWQARCEPFVAPILSWAAEGDVLWLVSHDVLHYLPLHALRVAGEGTAAPPYLIERNPVCYSPSASVMPYCHAKRKPTRGGAALVLGDSRPERPLPFAREEARRVAQVLGCAPVLGPAATRRAVVAALADEAGPLHRLCEATAARRKGRSGAPPLLRSRLDPRPESPLWLRSLEGHTDRVNAVAVSPDGRFIVSGSRDATVKIWEVESGRLLRSLGEHTGWVKAVAVSPNGRWIVSGSDDHTVRAWDLESGEGRVLFWNDAAILSLAISRDGRLLACGDAAGRVWIFDWVP